MDIPSGLQEKAPGSSQSPILAASCPATTGWAGRFGRWRERPQSCVCPGQGPGLASTNRQPLPQPGHDWPGAGTPPHAASRPPTAAQPSQTLLPPLWIEDLNTSVLGDLEARPGPSLTANGSTQPFANGFCEHPDVCRWEVGTGLRPWSAPFLSDSVPGQSSSLFGG